jgi:GLPGLI family protein
MKTKISMLMLFFLSFGTAMFAQKGNRILTVSYTMTPQSPKVLAMLKSQIANPEQLAQVSSMLSDYKFYYTLFVDIKGKKSVFALDSVHKINKVSVFGNLKFSVKNETDSFYTAEKFINSEYVFSGKKQELEWQVSKEQATLGKFKCLKATLKNSPDVVVWFAPELPVSSGPGYSYGLPGLVIKAQTNFDETVASKVAYSADIDNFNTLYKKYSDLAKAKKYLSLDEVVKSKNNFVKQIDSKLKK